MGSSILIRVNDISSVECDEKSFPITKAEFTVFDDCGAENLTIEMYAEGEVEPLATVHIDGEDDLASLVGFLQAKLDLLRAKKLS